MPRTLLEGAALGKPLIATDVPGCREIARQGVNALLCKVADAQSLADAMLAMLAMPEAERARLGRAGRRIAEEEFDERIVSDRYLEALERALVRASIRSTGGASA
jgi:glycosyltransferase involved in cell wall biosynthesis